MVHIVSLAVRLLGSRKSHFAERFRRHHLWHEPPALSCQHQHDYAAVCFAVADMERFGVAVEIQTVKRAN